MNSDSGALAPKKESEAVQLGCILEDLARVAEDVAEMVALRLIPVARPTPIPPPLLGGRTSEEWPPLFAAYREYATRVEQAIHSVRQSVNNIGI